jgi:hypothetical protein
MPSFNIHTQNLAANATADLLTGWQYEYLPWPAVVEVGLIHDGAAGGVVATVTSGSDVLMQESPVNAGGTDGVFPTSEQLDMADQAAAGDRLAIRLRETGGVATTDIMTRIVITPLV